MYKLAAKFHDYNDDEFIIIDELVNVVALMNCRTNSVHWVTRHILKLEYVPNPPTTPSNGGEAV